MKPNYNIAVRSKQRRRILYRILALLLVCSIAFCLMLPKLYRPPLTINEMAQKYRQEFTLRTLACSMNCSMFYERAVNNTVMVVQVLGKPVHLDNMLCSLQRIDPALVDRVIVWAFDRSTYELLDAIPDKRFGVVYDLEAADFGPSNKQTMMLYRPRFFLKIVKMLGISLFFVDADVVFYRDPWPWVAANNGLGIDRFEDDLVPQELLDEASSSSEKFDYLQRASTQMLPDIVYSSDARRFYHQMKEPFEGGAQVPKICGGLLLYKSTPNTISFLQALLYDVEVEGGNDQWSVDTIMNQRLQNVLVVGKLPRCLPRWDGLTAEFCEHDTPYVHDFYRWPRWIQSYVYQNGTINLKDILKVRVLDQTQFTNGAIMKQRFIRGQYPTGMDYIDARKNVGKVVLEPQSLAPAHVTVAYHGNYEAEFDKTTELKAIDAWFLDDKGQCLLN